MHSVHAGLSIVATLKPGSFSTVDTILKQWDIDYRQKNQSFFKQSKSTLFATGVIVTSQNYHGEILPDTLLLLTSFHGPLKYHVNELTDYGARELQNLFKNCLNFPDDGLNDTSALKKFLIKHRKPDTFYTGMQHITCTDIEREESLRKEIADFIDDNNSFPCLGAQQIRDRIQTYIRSKKDLQWAERPLKKPIMNYVILYGAAVGYSILLLTMIVSLILGVRYNLLFLIISSPLLLLVAVIIRFKFDQKLEDPIAEKPANERLKELCRSQNHPVINELTVAGPLKKGWGRKWVLIIILRLISSIRFHLSIATIATARWIATDNGKRLVFISNFANRSDSYVRDFVDSGKSARKINIIFSHGTGYPKTEGFTKEGASSNPEGFMNVFHHNQHVTQFWYSPYLNLSVDNINNNRKIRMGLFGDLRKTGEIQQWLSLL